MTSISSPLTIPKLFKLLLRKGYKPPPCGQHTEGGYCCAQAVIDFYEDFGDDTKSADSLVKNFLELDRLNVFSAWYDDDEEGWGVHLDLAHDLYARGKIGLAVDYLLFDL